MSFLTRASIRFTAGAIVALPLTIGLAAAQTRRATSAQVDAVFASFDRADAPGCAVAIVRGSEVVYAHGYGMADLEHDVRITPRTVFYLASVSKQFTAMSIVLLAQQGKLSLDDDVRKFVPEVPHLDVPVTIRHLLHHTSGLRDYFDVLTLAGWPGDGPISERDFVELVSRQQALNFEPGTEYLYSNTGYVLLSLIVKRASGRSIREFAADEIFRPLGMASTQFRDDHTMPVKGRAAAYRRGDDGVYRLSMPGFDLVGDGGVYSTVEDVAKWIANFYEGRVGGRGAIETMHTQGRLNGGERISYAFGLNLGSHRGHRTVDHGGSYGGYRTHLLRFPDERLAVATLCNVASADATALSRRVADLFLEDGTSAPASSVGEAARAVRRSEASGGRSSVLASRERTDARRPGEGRTVDSASLDLARYAGIYWNERTDTIRRIEAVNGKLGKLVLGGNPRGTELVAIGDGTFQAVSTTGNPSTTITFRPSSSGGMEMQWSGGTEGALTFVAKPAVSPPAEDLAALAGTYYSSEADARWVISVRDGQLRLKRPRADEDALRPAFEDAFTGRQISALRFTRDAAKRVTGFTVSTGRVRRLHFNRLH